MFPPTWGKRPFCYYYYDEDAPGQRLYHLWKSLDTHPTYWPLPSSCWLFIRPVPSPGGPQREGGSVCCGLSKNKDHLCCVSTADIPPSKQKTTWGVEGGLSSGPRPPLSGPRWKRRSSAWPCNVPYPTSSWTAALPALPAAALPALGFSELSSENRTRRVGMRGGFKTSFFFFFFGAG